MKSLFRKVIGCMLVIFLLTFYANSTIAAANDNINQHGEDTRYAAKSYLEKKLKFKHKGHCDNGPWNVEKDENGTIYAFEWDTYNNIKTNPNSSFWVGLYKMKWSKNGKLSYQKMKLNSAFAHCISGGDSIGVTKQDSLGNLFVSYYIEKNDRLTVLNSKGKIIKDYLLEDELEQFIEDSTIRVRDIYILDTQMVLYVSENYGKQDSIQILNWKTGERLSAIKIENMLYPSIVDGYLYGIKRTSSTKETTDISNTSSDQYKFVKLSLEDTNEIWSQTMPEGDLEVESTNKFDYDIVGNIVYVSNSNGIYSTDMSIENEDFSMIMTAENSMFLSDRYYIVDLKVINDKCFYILAIEGTDNEWPTDLGVYTCFH